MKNVINLSDFPAQKLVSAALKILQQILHTAKMFFF